MWDHKSNFDYFISLPENKARLCFDMCGYFKIPKTGVAIVFDNSDYHQSANYSQSIWKNIGNYLNIKEGDGNNETTPPPIANLIQSMNYSHLIWLSKRAWDEGDIDFVWNLSHELRHLEQDLENRFLALTNHFLVHNLKGIDIEEPKLWITVPTEFDAELTAWRIVRKLFNSQCVNLYLNNLCNSGEKTKHFQILTEHNPEDSFDVRANLISLLRKYQTELDGVIERIYGNTSILKCVDNICSELTNAKTRGSGLHS